VTDCPIATSAASAAVVPPRIEDGIAKRTPIFSSVIHTQAVLDFGSEFGSWDGQANGFGRNDCPEVLGTVLALGDEGGPVRI
jgi:hypothetical protein